MIRLVDVPGECGGSLRFAQLFRQCCMYRHAVHDRFARLACLAGGDLHFVHPGELAWLLFRP